LPVGTPRPRSHRAKPNRNRPQTHALPIFASLLLAATSLARPIHYGAVDHPAITPCDTQTWQGETNQATACYEEALAADVPAAIRAEAAWALGDLHAANGYFQTASREAPDDPAVLTRWGDLYAASHQDAEAMNIYREALAIDAQYPYALLGAASLLVGSFSDEAGVYLEPLLSNATLHEGAQTGAWLLTARMAIESGALEDAEHGLEKAAALIEQNDWPPLEIYALRAALDVVNDVEGDSEWIDKSLAYNPGWGSIYATPAHFYVITRRYRDAIDFYQKAVDVEPGLAAAHEELGVNLLRDNQINRARRHLEQTHDIDPFSPVAVNTLRLLDSFSEFPLIQDPTSPTADGKTPIVLRLHKDESAAIAPYAIELTRRAIDEFTERYEFSLKEPVIIEMYPDHEDFAVRTAGMPGIGILGATFGYVVAMDSPSARSTDQFQWGTTLWHEIAHVFTLEASDHLVPRWFSEGVSVYEEWRSGPTPGVRLPMNVYAAIRDDKFLPVATLDQGFIRPSYEDQVIVSYMQAGLICQFIDERYGDGKLALLLREFGEGAETAEALSRVLEVTAPAFDREFEVFLQAEHGDVLNALDDWQEAQTAGAKALSEEDWEAAIHAAEELIELHPTYVEPDSPYLLLARAYEETDQPDAMRDALRQFAELGGYDPDALQRYADLLEADGDLAGAIEARKTVALVQPLDPELHQSLGEAFLATNQADEALKSFEIVLAQDAYDKASAYYQIARAHHALGQRDESRDNLLLALDVAPGFRDAQRLLLEVMRDE